MNVDSLVTKVYTYKGNVCAVIQHYPWFEFGFPLFWVLVMLQKWQWHFRHPSNGVCVWKGCLKFRLQKWTNQFETKDKIGPQQTMLFKWNSTLFYVTYQLNNIVANLTLTYIIKKYTSHELLL